MTLIGVHGLQCHAAAVFDDLGGHLVGQADERLFSLGPVVLGVQRNMDMLLAAAVDGVVHQMLNGIQGLAPAADDGAHVGTVHDDVDAVVVRIGELQAGFHVHVLKQAHQELRHFGSIGILGIVLNFQGLLHGFFLCCGSFFLFGCLLLFLGGGFFLFPGFRCFRRFLLRLIRSFVTDADHGRRGADAQKTGFGAFHDLHGDIVALQAQFFQSRSHRILSGASAFFQCLYHIQSSFTLVLFSASCFRFLKRSASYALPRAKRRSPT